MSALTKDNVYLPKFRNPNGDDGLGVIIKYPVAASTAIYRGGLVGLDTSGYLTRYAPQTVGTTVVGGIRLMGWALEAVASQTSAGDKNCSVRVGGRFQYTVASTSIADVGKPVYASDDQTLTLSALGNDYVGWIDSFVSVDDVVIQLDAYRPHNQAVSRWSPIISVAAANIVTVIPKSWNGAGLYVREVVGVCTTDISTTPVITLQDTAGTTLGITFSPTSATDALEHGVVAGGAIQLNTTDNALVFVPAGLGVDAMVTTVSGTGAMKFWVECIPAI